MAIFLRFRSHRHYRLLPQNATSSVHFSSWSSSNSDDYDQIRTSHSLSNLSYLDPISPNLPPSELSRALLSRRSIFSSNSSNREDPTQKDEICKNPSPQFTKLSVKDGIGFSGKGPYFLQAREALKNIRMEEELKKLGTRNKNSKFLMSLSNERPRKIEEKEIHNKLQVEQKSIQKSMKNAAVHIGEDLGFMSSPPKEVLVEKNLGPNNMSSQHNQKLMDNFKMSKSDCESASVKGLISNKRNYRRWSSTEDAKLVEALVKMVNIKGFKPDKRFKSGYLVHLEQLLKESIPESGILGKPHIQVRLNTMRKDWQMVYDMLNANSGFGYDKEHNCVTTNAPGIWESYLENHKWAAKWKHKKFPHYEDLCVVFGKNGAQDDTSQYYEYCTNTSVDVEETSSARNRKHENLNKSSYLRGNFSDDTLFVEFTSEGIRLEVDLEKKTAMITKELSKITSLTQWERFTAIKSIKSDRHNVTTFWELSEEEREDWVRFIMYG